MEDVDSIRARRTAGASASACADPNASHWNGSTSLKLATGTTARTLLIHGEQR